MSENKVFGCSEVRLSRTRLVELRQAGKVQLGIVDAFAARMAQDTALGPQKTTANTAFHFWNIVAMGGFLYTLYLSFTDVWWWGIVGFVGCIWLFKSNKKGNSENYLDAAMVDEGFYQRVQNLEGWLYQMTEQTFYEVLKSEERV